MSTYIELIGKFWEYNRKKKLGSSVISFYLFLLEYWKNNNYQDFTITDKQITNELNFSPVTIIKIRKILKELNIIQIQSQNGLPISYHIIEDYSFILGEPKKVKEEIDAEKENLIEIDKTKKVGKVKPKLQKRESLPDNIPTLEEFMAFAKTLKPYNENLDFQLQSKYKTWIDAGWKNGYGNKIHNWQNSLSNSISYLNKPIQFPNFNLKDVPSIQRPKITYDE